MKRLHWKAVVRSIDLKGKHKNAASREKQVRKISTGKLSKAINEVQKPKTQSEVNNSYSLLSKPIEESLTIRNAASAK